MDVVAPIDLVSTLTFAVALLLALRIRTPAFDRVSRIFLALSLGIYVVVGVFNVLQHTGVTAELDRFEDYLEIVFTSFFLVFVYSVHVGADLLKRKEAEASLRASERQYRALVEAIPHGIVECDLDGTIVFSNSAHARMLGRPPGELPGTPIAELAPTAEEREQRAASLERMARAQPEPTPWFGRDRGAGGAVREVRVDWDYRRDAGGRVTGFICLVTDVTEIRRTETELAKVQRLESLGVLAGGLAHDFNNLLTAILGNVSLARLGARDEGRVGAQLAEAERACLRARELTQQLTTFAKGGEPVKRPVDLARVIREAASFALSGSNIRCEIRVPEDLRPVDADEGQLSQTLNNLLLNAVQAMPDGGTVSVACDTVAAGDDPALASREGRFARVVVRDEGVGIAARHLPNVFDPYFTTKQGGTGLGLATVYSIVKRHQGEISVQSAPGEGTQVALYLPASDETSAREDLVEPEPREGAGRILLMDDEEQVREVGRKLLASLGYRVDVAAEGGRAVEMYGEAIGAGRRYAAVLLDLTVPGGLGGRETIRRLREIDPGVCAIVSSGYSDDPVMADHEAFGFRGVVRKPYTLGELSGALAHAVSQREAR